MIFSEWRGDRIIRKVVLLELFLLVGYLTELCLYINYPSPIWIIFDTLPPLINVSMPLALMPWCNLLCPLFLWRSLRTAPLRMLWNLGLCSFKLLALVSHIGNCCIFWQALGSGHSKCLSKCDFSTFLMQKRSKKEEEARQLIAVKQEHWSRVLIPKWNCIKSWLFCVLIFWLIPLFLAFLTKNIEKPNFD